MGSPVETEVTHPEKSAGQATSMVGSTLNPTLPHLMVPNRSPPTDPNYTRIPYPQENRSIRKGKDQGPGSNYPQGSFEFFSNL